MSRYCELKLFDVLKEEKPEMSKNRSKTTVVKNFPSESRSTKTRLGNLSLLKRKNDSSGDAGNDLAEPREIRLTNKLNTPTKSNILIQDVDVDSEGLRKVSKTKTEITAAKRKRYDKKVRNIEEPSSKKVSCAGNSTTVSSKNPDKRTIQSRKRKRKSRESCWENKLTGARRVSKRLSNLRMEKQKSLKSLGSSVEVSHISIKPKQPINFSARGKIKSKEELHGKPLKRRNKASYYRNHPEVQFNFGKLSHTKRLYPKIAAGRRPAAFTLTIKSTGSIQQNHIKRNKGKKPITYDIFDDDTNDSDTNSLIHKYVEDIQDEIFNESGRSELSESDITEDKETDKSKDQAKFKETDEESNVEAMSQEREVKTVVCDTVEEEFIDGSTIVIVDTESGENVECETHEENTRNEQSSVSEKNYEERKIAEKLFDTDEPSKTVPEDATLIIDLNQDKSEEKRNGSDDNGLNTNVSETDMKSETKNNERTSTAEDSSADSLATETIDITNTAD